MATLFTESHQCDQMAYYLKGLENYIHYLQILLSIKMLQSGPCDVFLYNLARLELRISSMERDRSFNYATNASLMLSLTMSRVT